MGSKMWLRALPLGILIVVLGIPPQAFTAFARQQEGPQRSTPSEQSQPPKPPTPLQQPQNQPPKAAPPPTSSIAIESTVVNVDAAVTDAEGNILTGLKRENFRVLDNGQAQQITNFSPSDAPLTVVMLMEFSKIYYGFFDYKSEEWAAGFLGHLKPQDWIAFKTFDLNTTLQVDFTQNKDEVLRAIQSLFIPNFSETTLFDSIIETLDQLRDVQGKKSILVLATGIDTLSKHNLDQTLKRLKETDVTIFCVGMGEEIDLYGNGGDMKYLQAKNELNTFAQMTGGYAWFPRFQGEMPDIFNSVAAFLRNQYTIGFTPSTVQDGKFHKVTVEVVDAQGNEMMLADKKGKTKKTIVHARNGYTAAVAPVAN
jgi:VWFA-related protein